MTLAGTPRALRIVHFSTADNEGGSGRAAYRIHRGLEQLGHTSHMLVGQKVTDDPHVQTVHGGGVGRIVDRLASEVTNRVGLQYVYLPSQHRVVRHPWVQQADVFQLYNTHGGYFATPMIAALSRRAPVVWRLSDMWPMTGHCAYAGDCTLWQSGCNHCPDLDAYPPLAVDTTALLWRMKQLIYSRSDLTIVAPTEWIAEQASKSPLLRSFPLRRIRNGIDVDVFRPVPKQAAREVIGIGPALKVVFFSAHVLDDNPRKGGPLLVEALQRLAPHGDTLLLLAGIGGDSWEQALSMPVKRLGFVRDDRLLAAAYSAADVFVAPSLNENLANTVLEAMACGTPAVVSGVGGMGEAVGHLENGYVAKSPTAEAVAFGIQTLLHDDALRSRLGASAREHILSEYSMQGQARQFASLYEEVAALRVTCRK